jgi:iron complex outermembrane recepter protein
MLYHARTARRLPLLLGVAALALPVAAFPVAARAQQAETPAPTTTAHDDDDDFHGPDIVVTAGGVGQLDILAGTSVVTGVELQRKMAGQIGEVLEDLPGVSATGFAPGASRPVLRGFQGERVRVLTDGIGAIDASNTSADHAVTIDPLTADRIEVLRGPASLLYGSSAIGGAVNVIDRRIPLRIPDEPIHFDGTMAADTATDLREMGGSIDAPLGQQFVVHVDGSWRKTDDLEIPGYAASKSLRAELLHEAAEHADEPEEAEELVEAANVRGIVENSGTETWSAGAGLSWIGDRATLGVSVGLYDTFYGVPLRPGAGHHHEEEGEDQADEDHDEHEEEGHEHETVDIDMRQWRGDLRGSLSFDDGPFSEIKTRWGVNNYTHTELENGETGTMFDVTGVEGRVELVQRGGLLGAQGGGSVGGQYYRRKLDATGEEAFVPPSTTSQYAVFTLQEVDLDAVTLELAGRYEHADLSADGFASRNFDSFSGAVGVWHETSGGLRFGLNASRVERAPAGEELFADGPHPATQQYEVGDPFLDTEKALGVEAYLRGSFGPATFSLTGFATKFDDYIYLAATGEEADDLPVYQQMQDDADYIGFEAETSFPLVTLGDVTIGSEMSASYVRAELDDGSPVPLIPPLSARYALTAQTRQLEGRVELGLYDDQDRVADYETKTDGFTMVDASLAWKPWRGNRNLTVIAQADNIFDVEGRRHASATKDFVPMAGRNFKLSLRVSL